MERKSLYVFLVVLVLIAVVGIVGWREKQIGPAALSLLTQPTRNSVCDGSGTSRPGESFGDQANCSPTSTAPLTVTPGDTSTPIPTKTAPVTLALASPSPTKSSVVDNGQDPLYWHPPSDHHHGLNPADYPDLAAIFPLIGIPEYGLRPDTIKSEAHRGDIWLYADASELVGADGICDWTGNITYTPEACVKRVLLRIHNVGHEQHAQVEFHTVSFVAEVCTTDGGQCGMIGGSELVDYGTAHCPYKQEYCPDTYTMPAGYEKISINQSPYRSSKIFDEIRSIGEVGINSIWSGLKPAQVIKQYYPQPTNEMIGVVWGVLDSWQVLYPDKFAEPTWSCDYVGEPPDCQYNATRYQLWTVDITPPTDERPAGGFQGYTTPAGLFDPDCTEANENCYPVYIGENVPVGVKFELVRFVHANDPLSAPIMEFDTGSGITRP